MAKKKTTETNNPEKIIDIESTEQPEETNPFKSMYSLLDDVWCNYWKIREVINFDDPYQKKRSLEFEQGFRDIKRAVFDLENANNNK